MNKTNEQDLLLSGEPARRLYHGCAAALPMAELAADLSAKELAANAPFSNIARLLLPRHADILRLMALSGADPRAIAPDAADYERFRGWCACVPALVGHPFLLFQQMMLRRLFGCDLPLSERNCDTIWALTAERLAQNPLRPSDVLATWQVSRLFPVEEPGGDLTPYRQLAKDSSCDIRPLFSPDGLLAANRPGFTAAVRALGSTAAHAITDLASLESALRTALDRFAEAGCICARHTLPRHFTFLRPDPYHAEQAFAAALRTDGRGVSSEQQACFTAQMLRFLGREYRRRGWGMQLVLAGEHDAQHDALLDYLTAEDSLPRTLILTEYPPIGLSLPAAYSPGCRAPEEIRRGIENFAAAYPVGCCRGLWGSAPAYLRLPEQDHLRRLLCTQMGAWLDSGLYPAAEEKAKEPVAEILCGGDAFFTDTL